MAANTHSIDLEAGSSQYLSEAGLGITTDWSASCWINLESQPSGFGEYGFLSDYNGGINEGNGWKIRYIDLGGGSYRLNVLFTNDAFASFWTKNWTGFATATWIHIVAIADISAGGAGVSVYFDNAAQTPSSTQSSAITMTDGAAFNVGAVAAGSFFDGLIDEVAVYNDLLTAAEVQDLYLQEDSYCALISTDANLVAYYSLNNTLVSVPAGNNLTNNNSATFSTTVPFVSDSCAGSAANHWLCMGV